MSPIVSEGINLALYGMGTVFVFLTMLVFATMAMSWLVQRFSPLPGPATGSSRDAKKLAAITAAIHAHRSKQS